MQCLHVAKQSKSDGDTHPELNKNPRLEASQAPRKTDLRDDELDFGNYGTHIADGFLAADVYYPQTIMDLKKQHHFSEEPLWQGNPTAIVYHFPNLTQYTEWNGTDFTPWNRERLHPNSNWRKTSTQNMNINLGTMHVGPDSAKNFWTIQRIGPLTSRGCYDWWQFAAHDFLGLSQHLKQGQIQISGHYIVGTDVSGDALPYPPIHIHHVHVVPEHELLRFQYKNPGCFEKNETS
jgi:hypothetical protein